LHFCLVKSASGWGFAPEIGLQNGSPELSDLRLRYVKLKSASGWSFAPDPTGEAHSASR